MKWDERNEANSTRKCRIEREDRREQLARSVVQRVSCMLYVYVLDVFEEERRLVAKIK